MKFEKIAETTDILPSNKKKIIVENIKVEDLQEKFKISVTIHLTIQSVNGR